ncbi:Aste57867_22541 [Aphanomyces stellatus]|uniref:Aste57867_22541 protein n=1 Tax=Aphanomyces stellatus TaxID=120398 RepID=A0A485LLN7_9STRA|nr:hypothetical protein As57867_022471 [Aphanomyces stellatus]VFT99201.1 Aste57867_22541 [Aphanomyces stellatus]
MPLPRIKHPNQYVNLQRLINLPVGEYIAPPPPAFDQDLDMFQRPADLAYGHATKSLLFPLDPHITLLNHGSFGACSKPVLAVRDAYQALQEFEPLKFMEDYFPRIARVTRVVASYLNAEPRQIALVPNASAASTSVLRSFPFPPNSVIISFDLEYGAVAKQLNHVCATVGLQQHIVRTAVPFSKASILAAFQAGLDACAGRTIGMVVVDHITSVTGLLLPLEDIIAMCRARDIPVLVDGAHAIGQIPLDLTALAPDFYLSNFHKWMLAPKSAAFLYIREPEKYHVHPPIVSHGHGMGIASNFSYIGTLDYATYLSLPASLAFHEKMGGTALMQRNHLLCVAAAQKLARAWQTSLITDDVEGMIGSICVVLLPQALFDGATANDLPDGLETLHLVLRKHYKIEVKTVCVHGQPGLRISVQMYNDAADYDLLETAVLDILTRDASELAV